MGAPKFSVLFGAGASKDAGLPDAFELTEAVYTDLASRRSPQARLFAIIVSKLILRNARKGNSPFARVNIEEAYDALKRLANRDTDPLVEFVSGWDSSLLNVAEPINAEELVRSILLSLTVTNRRRFDGGTSLEIDSSRMRAAAKILESALGQDGYGLQGSSLQPFLETLTKLLDVENKRTDYMESFLSEIAMNAQCVATLNYDLLVERSLKNLDIRHDLGLSKWNKSRYVRFHGRSLKLIKLHGSVDWQIKGEDEIEVAKASASFRAKSGMIFGGQSDKLVPYGPFLHLRHEFYKFLQQSSYLVVVGYSYGDIHLNALLRSWISTRRSGKIINVDPGGFRAPHDVYLGAFMGNDDGKGPNKKLEIVNISKGFAESIREISEELARQPDLQGREIISVRS